MQDALQAPGVLLVHIDDVIPVAVLGARDLTGAVASHGHANLAKLSNRAVVGRVAKLFSAGCGRINDELVLASGPARRSSITNWAIVDRQMLP